MTYRLNYRAAQGQVHAGTPGGGYALDQIQFHFPVIASASISATSLPIAIMPDTDTLQAVSATSLAFLGDYNPISVAPRFRVVRAALALSISVTSVASTSAPIVQLTRNRIEGGAASGSVSAAIIATWDLSAFTASLPWATYVRDGSLVSNFDLTSRDVLTFNTSAVSGTVSLPAGILTIDFQA